MTGAVISLNDFDSRKTKKIHGQLGDEGVKTIDKHNEQDRTIIAYQLSVIYISIFVNFTLLLSFLNRGSSLTGGRLLNYKF